MAHVPRTCTADTAVMTSCAALSSSCKRLVAERGALEVAMVGRSCFATMTPRVVTLSSVRDATVS
jgi:hypothetical protein